MTTLAEINQKAHAVLRRELGPADYVRFLQQFDVGSSDYTSERQKLSEGPAQAIHTRTLKSKENGSLPMPENATVLKLD
ncbi:hypothetical protein AYO49_05005 [Verrucomicrobiaceae bacterium SCGC AG-212-N21]|nr:hypothetical protein AYO49_05005 [Verrucomicrobiaceae bacterium SCGC AG-212-N21]